MDFGKTLKNLRKEKKYTQKQLAKHLGVANSTISMYERNERFPDYNTMISLANIFNVDINFLYNYKISTTKSTKISDFPFSPLIRNITEHEGKVLDAYRKQPEMQPAIDKLLGVSAEEEETVTLYTAAYSKENSPDEIITISKAEWEKLKKLPTTDQDLK